MHRSSAAARRLAMPAVAVGLLALLAALVAASLLGDPAPTPPAVSTTPSARAASEPPASATPRTEEVVGYGADTVGGSGGEVLTVDTADELRAALEASGPRIVTFDVPSSGATLRFDERITVVNPNVTIDGSTSPGPVTLRGWLVFTTSEVIIRDVRIRPGDIGDDNMDDREALTINGRETPVSDFIVDGVSMMWGPDVGGISLLGDVRDVTVQYSIIGPGLHLSKHSEGTEERGGHSYAANIAEQVNGHARRITFYRNLFHTSDKRGPAVQGAECFDLVENTHYNFGGEAANGNPRSANIVNGYYRSGPVDGTTDFWRTQENKAGGSFRNSIYVTGNVADGFSGTVNIPERALADDVRCGSLSAPAESAEAGHAAVLANVGAQPRDVVDVALVEEVVLRTGARWNGEGHPGPNPHWPY
ncbi:MAG: hypothetical protein ACRDGB_02650 [Candidatus Limnocylindria bacterium]